MFYLLADELEVRPEQTANQMNLSKSPKLFLSFPLKLIDSLFGYYRS